MRVKWKEEYEDIHIASIVEIHIFCAVLAVVAAYVCRWTQLKITNLQLCIEYYLVQPKYRAIIFLVSPMLSDECKMKINLWKYVE